jgi:hypothetical protein
VLKLTDPEGDPVYIAASSILSVSKPIAQHFRARAFLMTAGGPHAVQETVEQVMSMLPK